MILTRRRFFSLLPAPLIVSAANIMPVKALLADPEPLRALAIGDVILSADGSRWYAIRLSTRYGSAILHPGDSISIANEYTAKWDGRILTTTQVSPNFSGGISIVGSRA